MRLSRSSLVALAAVAAPAVAHAGDGLPFTDDELAAALRVRVAAEHRVDVRNQRGVIVVIVDGRAAAIELGDQRGPDAARLVALIAAGMALDAAPTNDPLMVDAPVPVPASAAAVPGRWSLAVRGAGGDGAGSVGLAAAVESSGRLRWIAGLGVERASAMGLEVYGVPVRVGVALGDRYAIGASALATVAITSAGTGDAGVLLGAGLHARAIVALPAIFDLAISGGVDLMANQRAYRWDGEVALRSGHVRPWLALGLCWERR